MKKIITIAVVILLQSCATHGPPKPKGVPQPVNDTATIEMLAHEAGLVVVGPQGGQAEIRERFKVGDVELIAKPMAERQKMFRDKDLGDYTTVRGARLVNRTVYVPFEYGSTEMLPTPFQRFHIRQLLAEADRCEVRGRTDGRKVSAVDSEMARRRAEAAKRYLLDAGMPRERISVSYDGAGDYVADNERKVGQGLNRRVELECYVDDFTGSDL